MSNDEDRLISRRLFLELAGAAAAAVGLAACGSDSDESSTTATTTAGAQGLAGGRTVTVKTCVYARNHASSMLYWQRFAPPGVTVNVVPVTTTAEILQGLEGGTLDFGLMSPYVPMLTQPNGGINSKVVAMVARQGFGLVGKKGEVASVNDLRGKKVGVPPPGAQVLILNSMLAKAGLALGRDVEGVPLGYADHLAALTRGDIQAFMGTEPPATQAVVNGVGVRVPGTFDTPLGDLNTALWASPSILRDDEVVRAVVKMQKDAAEYLTPAGKNDPNIWRDLIVTQFGYDEALYRALLDNVGAQWQFDRARQSQFEAVGKALVENKELAREPNYEAMYARQYWTV
ncbi:MAG: ABC transporter substrate-binding protein [Acidimicrobiales bacterium]